MNKQSIILSTAGFIASALMFAAPISANDICTTQYGGTTTCVPSDLTINKQVKNPITNSFVENLTTTDATFGANGEITYKLSIHNGSGETFQAEVKDFLPSYLSFVSGPGTYDEGKKMLTVKLENLIAGETRDFEIKAKVSDKSAFPAGKSLFCVNNVAEVRALNRFDSDSAQACIGENVLGVTYLPVAGFDNLSLLLPFVGVGLGGIAILKGKKRG